MHSFFHRDSRQKKKRASRVFVAKKKKRASRVCQLAHGMPFGALPESFAKKWICVISSAANRIFPGNLRNIFQYLISGKSHVLHTQKSQMRHQTLLEIHIYTNLTVLATSEWIYLNTMWNLSLVPSQNENNEALVLLRISDLGKILSLKIWWHQLKILKSTFFAEGGFYDLLWNFVFLVFLCF